MALTAAEIDALKKRLESNRAFVEDTKGPLVAERPDSPDFASNWFGFLDALGMVESYQKDEENPSYGDYNANNGQGYRGIYQQGKDVLGYIKFFESVAPLLGYKPLKGVDEKSEAGIQHKLDWFQGNPIAQQVAGLMQLSGTPSKYVDGSFSSTYGATLDALPKLLNEKLGVPQGTYTQARCEELIKSLQGETITIDWGYGYKQSFKINQASISGAAHLVGQGDMAKALSNVLAKTLKGEFTVKEVSENGVIKRSLEFALDPTTEYYGDGNKISFASYMSLFDRFDITPLIKATSADFNGLLEKLLWHNKDELAEVLKNQGVTLQEPTTEKQRVLYVALANALGRADLLAPELLEDVTNTVKKFLSFLPDPIKEFAAKIMGGFTNASSFTPPRGDPLILDLDGDGISTLGIDAKNPILFDHDHDGVKQATGWINAKDGFLVLDRDGNGTIDHGGELFGDHTILSNGTKAKDALEALRDQDSSGDGRIDSRDQNFSKLKVWIDSNSNGISEENELHTLDSLGITSIH